MDGDIDYSKYSRGSLEEALSHIDKIKYPLNHARLLDELNGRPPDVPEKVRTQDSRKLVNGIGWYLLAASLLCAHALVGSNLSGMFMTWGGFWAGSALIGLFLLTGAAGLLTVRHHRLGITFSVASLATQAVAVRIGEFSYRYTPLFGVRLFWDNGELGVTGVIGPAIDLSVGNSGSIYLAIDVLAVAGIFVLARFSRRRNSVR